MIRGFDDQQFQRRIDARVGTNRDGKSILRLVYAPTVRTWALGEDVPRYWTKRWLENGVWKYEQPDRFVLERRIEREVYWDAHIASRFQVIDATGELVDLGPPPVDFYIFESLIAVHSGFTAESGQPECCERAWKGEEKMRLNHNLELVKEQVGGRMRCWGEYREPNDDDLGRIEQAVRRMREDPYYNPYAPMSPEQLAACEIEANLDAQRMAEAARAREQEISRDFARSYDWTLFASHKTRREGRWFDVGRNLGKGWMPTDAGIFVEGE